MAADPATGSIATIADAPIDETLRTWFGPVLEHGSRWCGPNIDTRCAFLRIDGLEFPLTVNDAEWDNSWVCSPFTQYVSYAQEEVARAVPRGLAAPACVALRGIGRWLRRADFNRVVMVNNWLMSTNPWPPWDGDGLTAVLAAIRAHWPDHAVVFRSLSGRADVRLVQALADAGARIIPSRQIWLFEPDSTSVRDSTNWKHDLRLLRRDDLERVPHESLGEDDFARIAELYDQLYLDKYSQHNPAYTSEWLHHLWQNGLLRFTALRDPGGALVGVEARGVFHGTMVSPVVGYALSRPSKLGLYRRLAAIPVLAAREEGIPLNLSAGAGRFKALRGGEPVMEYVAVFDRHLPLRRRLPWRAIELLSRYVLAPVARHRGL